MRMTHTCTCLRPDSSSNNTVLDGADWDGRGREEDEGAERGWRGLREDGGGRKRMEEVERGWRENLRESNHTEWTFCKGTFVHIHYH